MSTANSSSLSFTSRLLPPCFHPATTQESGAHCQATRGNGGGRWSQGPRLSRKKGYSSHKSMCIVNRCWCESRNISFDETEERSYGDNNGFICPSHILTTRTLMCPSPHINHLHFFCSHFSSKGLMRKTDGASLKQRVPSVAAHPLLRRSSCHQD